MISVILPLTEWHITLHAESLLDHYLPKFDESEHHSIFVNAPPATAYEAVCDAPIASSAAVRALLFLRQLPSMLTGGRCETPDPERATLRDLIGNGFFLVDEQPGREIVLGKIGRFWRADGGSIRAVEDIRSALQPGTAAAVWNFRVAGDRHGSVVHTETRVRCAEGSAQRNFRFYWKIIAPFSALIRRKILKSIKEKAERSVSLNHNVPESIS